MSEENRHLLSSMYSSCHGSCVVIGLAFERTPSGYELAAAHLRAAVPFASPETETVLLGAIAAYEAMSSTERARAADAKEEEEAHAR